MPFYSNIECWEEAGTPSENYDDKRGHTSASVQLRCAWENRHLLVADICGLRRPWPHGMASGAVVPRATTAAITPVVTPPSSGFVTINQSIVYGQALVTVNYTSETADVITDAIEPTSEFITLDHRNFRWHEAAGDLVLEEEAPGQLVRGINFTRNISEFYGTLPDEINDLIGYVNDTTIESELLGLSFAPETLLYAPPSVDRRTNLSGNQVKSITMKWSYKPEGWNKYYRTKRAGWYYMYNVAEGGTYRSYPLGDFTALLELAGLELPDEPTGP